MNIDYKSTLSATYGLPMDDIELLLSHTSAIKFAKGDFIVRKGGRNNNLYLVEQGVIRAFRENDAEEVALWFAAEGEVVLQVWGYCRDLPSEENFQCETDLINHKDTFYDPVFSKSTNNHGDDYRYCDCGTRSVIL